jgi:hypothetical protein
MFIMSKKSDQFLSTVIFVGRLLKLIPSLVLVEGCFVHIGPTVIVAWQMILLYS